MTAARGPLPAPWAKRPGEPSLQLVLTHSDTPGVAVVEPSPDWRGYRSLKFDIVNPESSPLRLILRIHDRWHDQEPSDRFNRGYVIEARTRGTIEVALTDIASSPRTRKLDLANVAGVGLFEPTESAVPGEKFYLVNLRLE
jgi:hypothetical protein